MRGAEQIRELRNRLGISTREVEEYSRRIAELEQNQEFLVSNARLSQLENLEQSIPSVYKLYSLSVIYRVNFVELLSYYGLDLERISKYQALLPLAETRTTTLSVYNKDRLIGFPIRFDPGFALEKTSLFSRMVEAWGEIPIALLQHLNLREQAYGYVGLNDRTMFPILRPGSFVQIDDRFVTISKPPWRTEFERPIYFVEHRDAYTCSWCELQGEELFLVPHPLSGTGIRRVNTRDTTILGQVTAVAMRIVPDLAAPDEPSKQLAPPGHSKRSTSE